MLGGGTPRDADDVVRTAHPRGRLDGWKEIAEYLRRTVRTIQRWERDEELPIHRHLHATAATVYAFTNELTEWQRLRSALTTNPNDELQASDFLTEGHDARTLSLMSRHQWAQRTRDGFHKSIALARTALQRHPEYAPAHGVLALAHATRASHGYAHPEADIARARESIALALALDRNVLEAHQASIVISLYFDWDWATARAAFEEAFRLDPSNGSTLQWFSLWHLVQDDDEGACRMAQRAEDLDPTSLIVAAHSAWMLHYSGRLEDAIAKARSIIGRNPHFWRGHFNLALSLDAAGRPNEAAQAAEVAAALNEHTALVAIHAHALARSGQTSSAQDILTRLEGSGEYVSPYWLAYAAAGLGNDRAAFLHLDESVSHREWFMLFLKHEPAFMMLRSAPAFEALRAKVGLP